MLALAIVFNNYFHDLATGVFAACAVVFWALARSAPADPERARALKPVFSALNTALWISLAWIILGGIPRTLFFPTYEFIPALGKGIVVALVVKHVFMFAAAAVGIVGWLRARSVISGLDTA